MLMTPENMHYYITQLGDDEGVLAGEAERGLRCGKDEEIKTFTAFQKLWVQRRGREEEHKPAPLHSFYLLLRVTLGVELRHLPLYAV